MIINHQKNIGLVFEAAVAYLSRESWQPGADWPSGEPGEFPVAWQPIWPAALRLFIFCIIYYYYFILLLLLFLLPTECTKVFISEFAIQ